MRFAGIHPSALGVGFVLTLAVAAAVNQSTVPEWKPHLEHRIGSINDSAQALTRVNRVLVARLGNIFVSQPKDLNIRVYGASGDLTRVIGRRGKGPGEFESIRSIGLLGDTLYVADDQLRRVSFFTLQGRFLRSSQWGSSGFRRGRVVYVSTTPDIILPDGSGLVQPSIAVLLPASKAVGAGLKAPWLHIERSGRIRDTTTWFDRSPQTISVQTLSKLTVVPNPFDDRALHVLMLDGSGIAIVERTAPTNATRASFTIRKIGPSGRTVFAKSYNYSPQQMSALAIARASENVLLRLAREGRPGVEGLPAVREVESAVRQSPKGMPKSQIPVSDAISDQDGSIWVKREPLSNGFTHWQVFDTRGDIRGIVKLPSRESIIAVRGSTLVTITFDEYDVPFLVRYSLRKAP